MSRSSRPVGTPLEVLRPWLGTTATLALLGAVPASAQLGAAYDASSGALPSAQGWTHILNDPTPVDGLNESNFSVAGGVLTQGDTGGGSGDLANWQAYQSTDVLYDYDQDVVEIEFRLRITSSTWTLPGTGTPRAGFLVTTSDLEAERVYLYIGGGALFFHGTDGNPLVDSIYVFDATAAMVDYVLRVDAKGASLRVNGIERSSMDRADFRYNPMSPPQSVLFGDWTSVERGGFELEYLRVRRSDPRVAEVRNHEMVTALSATQTASGTLTHAASCPPGKLALGGGAAIVGGTSSSYFRASQSTGGTPATGWTATAEGFGSGWHLRVDVLCGELPGLETIEVATNQQFGTGAASASCPFSHSPVSGGAETTDDPGDANPRLWGIGIDTGGQVSTARAGDFAWGGLPEGTDWGLTPSVTCSDAHGWAIVTEETDVASYSTISPKQATAICPAGTVAIGGGARVVGDGRDTAVLSVSRPQSVGPAGVDRWLAIAHDFGLVESRGDWGIRSTVVCAPHADPTVARWGRVGRWRADDGTADDEHGQNHGVLQNGAAVVPGLDGQAFEFERVNQESIEIPGGDFYAARSFSADAWIETSSVEPGDFSAVVNLYDAGGLNTSGYNNSYWALMLGEDGRANAWVRNKSSGEIALVANTTNVADGERHHLAMVQDFDNGFELRLYVDGGLVGQGDLPSGSVPYLSPGVPSLPDPLSIGAQRWHFTTDIVRGFEGLIDDVKYYDRALTSEEIERIAGCGIPVLPRVLNVAANRFGGPAGVPKSHDLCVMLDAGSYTLTLVNPTTDPDARFTAWAPDGSETGAWRTEWYVDGELEPGTTGGSTVPHTTAQDAFAATSPATWQLTLSQPQRVYFGIEDEAVLDNQGGVSLEIAVPEPGTGIALAAGAGLLMRLSRRRDRGSG